MGGPTWADKEVHDPVHPGLLVNGSLPARQLHALADGAISDGRHVLPQWLPFLIHLDLRLAPFLCRPFQPHPAQWTSEGKSEVRAAPAYVSAGLLWRSAASAKSQ